MTTPMRAQYLELKQQYPDTLLLFRLGDFYETFDEDAEVLADVCEVTLTSRPVGQNQRVPLAGVPYHSVDSYLAKLMDSGIKVAIAEQVSEPGKGLVDRKITQVLTRGTLTSPDLLTARSNRLAAVHFAPDRLSAGIAASDVTEGSCQATQLQDSHPDELCARVIDELIRLEPSEVLLPAATTDRVPALAPALDRLDASVSELEPWIWAEPGATRRVLEHCRIARLDGFGLTNKPQAVAAVSALFHYVGEYQPAIAEHLNRVQTYETSGFMLLDEYTRLNLELVENLRTRQVEGSLLETLDHARTPMGTRLLRDWLGRPLLDTDSINARLDAVEALFENGLALSDVQELLSRVGDLTRWVQRVVYGSASPRDLGGIRDTLGLMPDLNQSLQEFGTAAAPEFLEPVPECTAALDLLQTALPDELPATLAQGGLIREGFRPELDDLKRRAQAARERLLAMEESERSATGLPGIKVGFNRVFGYYLEVPKAQSTRVPDTYIRKQTLVNAERYFTEELKHIETEILNSEERTAELEQQLFREVAQSLQAHAEELRGLARRLARLDVAAALAQAARDNRYVRPEMHDGFDIAIAQGRHPVVEATLSETRFVPNDLRMTEESAIQILTGPNMAGKSTYLRQAAVICLMAQMGSFVPAESARLGLVDRIFTRIGASDAIQRGLSTFMVEMIETAYILNHATRRSLLILDEIGRGTSTYDGLAIAWAILEFVHNAEGLGAKTLFATHFHELTDLADRLPKVQNRHVQVDDSGGSITFLHTIAEGAAGRSFGVHVGRMAGLPKAVHERAAEILGQLEASGAAVPDSLTDLIQAPAPDQTVQSTLFLEEHPALQALRQLDVNSLSPMEAMNRLYDLVRIAEEHGS
ncbi:MAG: DNA mismatch repair protein MutS [Caldilineaceae bacterium SB0661_bin_34]|nr:DNA mismatch repair protein MutS [Caldilineaceae bacterium SB0661_bin_34]